VNPSALEMIEAILKDVLPTHNSVCGHVGFSAELNVAEPFFWGGAI
jgi:hypothetical protein